MVETLFKLGCLMCVCFIAVAYLFLAFEKESTATRHATPLSVAPAETSAVAAKKKSCQCCAERMQRVRERLRHARARRQTEKHVVNTQPRDFSERIGGSEVSAEDVPVSPHGFGPYPEVPRDYFRTPVWVKYDDFVFTRGLELIERVLIKLWKQGIYCSGGSIENGRVYPMSRGTVYVKWKGDFISDYIGHPDDDDEHIISILENQGTPAGIRVLDYDTAGIDPYLFLNL